MSADQTNTSEAVERLRGDAEAVWRHTPTGSGREYETVEVRVPDLRAALFRIMELEKALEEIRTVDKSRITKILGEDGQYHAEDGPAGKIAARVLTEGRK